MAFTELGPGSAHQGQINAFTQAGARRQAVRAIGVESDL
jgi:hypothetical protein